MKYCVVESYSGNIISKHRKLECAEKAAQQCTNEFEKNNHFSWNCRPIINYMAMQYNCKTNKAFLLEDED